MKNLFPFEYIETTLPNQDGTDSRFRTVYGENGMLIACPKNSYHLVPTQSVSSLAQAFENEGFEVSPFIHNAGAKIGLSVAFGNRPSKVGECQYKLVVTVPNDGSGMGYLAVTQTRLICSNGQTRKSTVYKDNNIKIPHTFKYEQAIELMKQSIQTYGRLLNELENRDIAMAEVPLKDTEVMFHLNKWFFECELPVSQKTFIDDDGKKQKYTLDMFRKDLTTDDGVPSQARYDELQKALKRELGYNKELKLDLSMYTVFATVTNYLSRRVEKSGSKAPREIKDERASTKLSYFDDVIKELQLA